MFLLVVFSFGNVLVRFFAIYLWLVQGFEHTCQHESSLGSRFHLLFSGIAGRCIH